jgi:nucleotide-binding universal stress UspA family protein
VPDAGFSTSANPRDAAHATRVNCADESANPHVGRGDIVNTAKRIIVGIPSIEAGNSVLPRSVELARRLDAELTLAHAYPPGAFVSRTYGMLGYSGQDAEQHYKLFLESQLQGMVAGVPDSGRIVAHAAAGAPEQVLSALAADREADLIVIGGSRRGTVWRRLIGGCADRTIRVAPCPVLVFRTPISLSGTRVLFATDLSDYSIGIHEQAMRTVAPLLVPGGKARSVLVVAGTPLVLTSEERASLECLARYELEHFLTERSSSRFGVEPSVRLGDPARQILNEAEAWAADLLVIGSRGHSGLERVLAGSVSSEVIAGAAINVLIVPPHSTEAAKRPTAEARRLLPVNLPKRPLSLAPGASG